MLKKIYSILLIAVFALVLPMSAFADEPYGIAPNASIKELAKINQMSEQEFAQFMKEQQKLLDEVFAKGKEKFANDQKMIKLMMQKDPEKAKKLYPKEIQTGSSRTLPTIVFTGTGLGSTGDILVTYDGGVSSSLLFLPGHAAIVALDREFTVESYPWQFPIYKSPTKKDGVQYLLNEWGKKTKVFGLRVNGAPYSAYVNAATYAEQQIGKPYNLNFFWKTRTDSFYCSQLVWRAWYNQGYDIDYDTNDNIVSPAELVKSARTYTFYYHS